MSAGAFTVERTGKGTDRYMVTIRYRGNYVAGISFHRQQVRNETKTGFWVQVSGHKDLPPDLLLTLKRIVAAECSELQVALFGGQQ